MWSAGRAAAEAVVAGTATAHYADGDMPGSFFWRRGPRLVVEAAGGVVTDLADYVLLMLNVRVRSGEGFKFNPDDV